MVNFKAIDHREGCPVAHPELRDPDEGPLECICADLRAGEVCEAVGHPDCWASTIRCDLCGNEVQWVRVEVTEGKAYTYAAFEEVPLERGEMVILPGNVVHGGNFEGRVLRVIDPERVEQDSYPGPYKAVVGRVEPRSPCTCGDGYDDDCPMHGGLL